MIIELPNSVLTQYSEEGVRLEIALALFQSGHLTLGQASRLADISKRVFQRELGKRKIAVHYDEEMLENDLQTLNDLNSDRS